MKIIITESQFADMFFKRRFAYINELVEEKMKYYPPCDYNYMLIDENDNDMVFHDYYGDVRNSVIFEIIEKDLNLTWSQDEMETIDELSVTMNEWMFPIFYDKVSKYFKDTLDNGCPE